MDPQTTPKISVKIWRPILNRFDEKLESACLRRDAYLSKVLEVELPRLDREVAIPNSQASYNYVSERLDVLDRKLVSLALPPELSKRLNDICRKKRIVRDAFFNRVFLLLAVKPKVIDELLFDDLDGENWRKILWDETKQDSKFFQSKFDPLADEIDPFWAIHDALDHLNEHCSDYDTRTAGSETICVHRDFDADDTPRLPEGIYTKIFQKKFNGGHDLLGLTCYMPDYLIPGHEAERKRQTSLDELFVSSEGLL